MSTDERPSLSERETEILALLATGATNQEIARQLVISPNTVKVHLRNIYDKLQVQSRTEATLVAIQTGVVQVDTPLREETAAEPAEQATPLNAPQLDLAAQPITAWQRVYLLVALILVLLALATPLILSGVRNSSAQPLNLLSDADTAQIGLPPRSDLERWRLRAALPGPRARHALAAFRSQLFALGGETPAGVTDAVDMYDPERNEWQPRSNLPQPVANVQAAVLKNLIYVPGGSLAGGQIATQVARYDPIADSWGQATPLPAPRAAYALLASEQALYLLGGWDGSRVVDSMLIFDPATATWQEGPRLPAPRALAGAALLEQKIVLVGGFDGSKATNTVFIYDLAAAAPRWQPASPLAAPRAGLGVAVEGRALYAIGGAWNAPLDYAERYDPFTNTWSTLPVPWGGEWRNLAVATLEPMIYVTGGWNGDYAEINEQYQAGYRTFMPASPR